ncbi:MAG: hypothetical protein KBG20_16155 [Caldilineaceae bacterium]|nr:hypothetical protein [Caldilineaceae bacterium]MBP8107170.1 hypothetical protein [Caldilineaceae bacterium]MBP8121514.1 hypothetical protein [Caldilineaceae bacterium]MBP9073842.1 hypothetical protein [Caldilineaceae bacterium]
MRELKELREGWDVAVGKETQLLRALGVQEGMRDLLRLQETFEPQLRQTAHLFASDRWLALAELQSRLYRLAQWQTENGQAENGQSLFVNPESPKASD